MEPSVYIPAYLEREYLRTHDGLTPAARKLVHEEIAAHPEKYVGGDHARSLLAYADIRRRLLASLERMEDLPDDEFEQKRAQLFDEARLKLYRLGEADRLCVDAKLVDIMLADVPLDNCINDLLQLERQVRDYLLGSVEGFDPDAPAFWSEAALYRAGEDAASRTASEPEVIGWLHTLEAISQLCLASARYSAAAQYARQVLRAQGYPTMAAGTLALALARLERQDEFFALAGTAAEGDAGEGASSGDADGTAEAVGWGPLVDSPWFLLGRTLLLYKEGREKPATRALREFASRCEGGAFFLLNPTYMTPYLPVRPPVKEAWKRSHQAVWEADGILADSPDFATWAASVAGIDDASEAFARRYGF